MTLPPPPPTEESWRPTRKVTAGGVAAGFWVVVVLVLSDAGIEVSAELASAVATLIGLVASYWTREGS